MATAKMATRPFFAAAKGGACAFYEENVDFEWFSGLSWQQRQRSSDSMAAAILSRYSSKGLDPNEILEISTASHNYEVGQALSALSLKYTDELSGMTRSVENWFQASKVFLVDGEEQGPFPGLLDASKPNRYVNISLDAKIAAQYDDDELFQTIQNSIRGGSLCRFEMGGERFPLVPRSGFYDYLYVRALCQPQNQNLADALSSYRVFTDIMFTPGTGKKQKFNTQARACAIFVALHNRGVLGEATRSFESFVQAVAYKETPAVDPVIPEEATPRLFDI